MSAKKKSRIVDPSFRVGSIVVAKLERREMETLNANPLLHRRNNVEATGN